MADSLLLRSTQRLLNQVLPSYLTGQVIFSLGVRRQMWKNAGRMRRLYRERKDLLINVGSGATGKAGWINVDAFPSPGVNCVWDCSASLPFADGSARGIFTEHFLEHLDYHTEAGRFLSECHRVLVTGGVLRIVVPDAAKYMAGYLADGWEALSRTRPLQPDRRDTYSANQYSTKMELVNFVFRQEYGHKFAYDAETLAHLLRGSGFGVVIEQAYGCSMDSSLLIDMPVRASESLYVEARKA